ncbi:peptidoglycan-binding domain-containing protein [Dactylosporangium sp. CS-033363]|uniref:peptidoglycan-binding domain-containing protein n=1 Tax=Dactylosporangium sp. CS-033363 TaxID=3239935 RepID=UPI003D8DFDD0
MAALVAAGVGVVATGTAAQAATPKCNAVGLIPNLKGGLLDLPVYRTGSSDTVLCGVYYGDRGDDVIQLQWTLVHCYSETGVKQDGIFGDKTKAALVRAQGREHISADGSYGPQTALNIFHPDVSSGGCSKL